MKFLLLSIASLCILSTATGLTCYSCAAENDCNENVVECTALSATAGLAQILAHKPSLQVIPSTGFKCYKLVVEPAATKTELAIKGCTYESTDVCAGVPLVAEQKSCNICGENECNGSSRQLGMGGLGLLLVAVMTLWEGYQKQ